MREVLAEVGPLLGTRPPAVQPRPDCGATAAAWPHRGVTLWFAPIDTPRFAGWSLHLPDSTGSDPTIATASGIRPGVTRAAVESVYATRVGRTTLGVEFTIGQMAGVLTGTEPDARVTHLWAGQVCLGR